MVDQMIADIIALSGSSFVYTIKKDGYGNVTGNNAGVTYGLFGEAKMSLVESLINIGKKLKASQNQAAEHYCNRAKLLLETISGQQIPPKLILEWNASKRKLLTGIAEALSGINNKAAFELYQNVISSYEKENKSLSKEKKEEYESIHRDLLTRMKQLDPSFDAETEMKKAEENAAKGAKKHKTSNIIGYTVAVLILIGGAALIMHILGVF